MDRILRGAPGWEQAIAEAVAHVTRPIPVDPRLMPRDATARTSPRRFDRSHFPPARAAATLLLLYPGEADGRDGAPLTIPLTVRHADLRAHAGEISLPGGAVDAGDASAEAAALREAEEEIGIDASTVRIAGALDEVWIPVSNFELRPVVGTTATRPSFTAGSDEVAEIIELPVERLLGHEALTDELIEGTGWRLLAGAYRHGDHRIWGATARILAMFAAVLREAGIGG
ncbi:MAG: NUDIX domain-containing protein [Chloroflexi bacterium]|nr:MAG: NUDIX domain-containing protein [Chloroflexota bacterium]